MSEFESFKNAVIKNWKKRRLPSFIKKRALDATFTYSYETRETYIVAWMQFGSKIYVVDITYSYERGWLELAISELPAPYSKLKNYDPLIVPPGKSIYKYEVRQDA
ncbi:hypothetical protein OCC_02982 [Thermococcus litoralis DSM 5473]|uniref:Uncharacterized protein n=1 Tax=Thermococcus litoralis (strain ATCC 51850 / DSM 5473 / JCM 8560 / NS-C) TaxID=523849 RepID=H3ZQ18_THELN|nr:hypothetical protein [Thermococcus litoralis]EHR77981.1 hypothetical protein OCC_02982 [Thermococcus litoralis DSM 5473]